MAGVELAGGLSDSILGPHGKMPALHAWDVTPQAAMTVQKPLAGRVELRSPIELEWIETAIAEQQPAFPYICGLLSFREGPVILEAHAQLHHRVPAIKCRAMSFKKLRALVHRIDSIG